MEQEPKQIRVKYKLDANYREVPVTGAWGGVGAGGMIHAQIFVEHQDIPEENSASITDDGVLTEDKNDFALLRYIQVGLIMRPEVAKSLAQWLLDKVEKSQELEAQIRLKTTEE